MPDSSGQKLDVGALLDVFYCQKRRFLRARKPSFLNNTNAGASCRSGGTQWNPTYLLGSTSRGLLLPETTFFKLSETRFFQKTGFLELLSSRGQHGPAPINLFATLTGLAQHGPALSRLVAVNSNDLRIFPEKKSSC